VCRRFPAAEREYRIHCCCFEPCGYGSAAVLVYGYFELDGITQRSGNPMDATPIAHSIHRNVILRKSVLFLLHAPAREPRRDVFLSGDVVNRLWIRFVRAANATISPDINQIPEDQRASERCLAARQREISESRPSSSPRDSRACHRALASLAVVRASVPLPSRQVNLSGEHRRGYYIVIITI